MRSRDRLRLGTNRSAGRCDKSAKSCSEPFGETWTNVVPVPCTFALLLKLLTSMSPATSLPDDAATIARPYGLTSPFAGTVEPIGVTVENVARNGRVDRDGVLVGAGATVVGARGRRGRCRVRRFRRGTAPCWTSTRTASGSTATREDRTGLPSLRVLNRLTSAVTAVCENSSCSECPYVVVPDFWRSAGSHQRPRLAVPCRSVTAPRATCCCAAPGGPDIARVTTGRPVGLVVRRFVAAPGRDRNVAGSSSRSCERTTVADASTTLARRHAVPDAAGQGLRCGVLR